MQKIQILFPDPLMKRLREVAELEDRPVSEVVRRAVERFLISKPGVRKTRAKGFPTFSGGAMKVAAENLKEVLYQIDV